MVDPSAHLWQMPFAILFLSAGLALYVGVACALAIYFWQDGPSRLLVFAAFYAAAEWLRGHALTGFPWNLQAYGWGASLAVMQSASLIGAYGLSFLTILLGASLAEFCSRRRLRAAGDDCFCSLGFGPSARVRLAHHTHARCARHRALRLVQPDIPQNEKYVAALCVRNWQRLLDLVR